ncbi:molecular chaperone [Hypoxylon texense]
MSFGITLLRVTEGRVRKIVLLLTVTMTVVIFLYIIFTFFKCEPKVYSWIKGPGCWSTVKYLHYGIFTGAYSAFVDFSFALIPWFVIMNLRMRKREKLGVAIAMSCGVIAGITAIVKCVYLPLLAMGTFSTQGTTLAIWFVAEPSVTIIAASIPVLRALVKEISPSTDRYGRSTSKKSGSKSLNKGTPRGLHGSNTVTVIGPQRDPYDPHGDAGSDKSILDVGRAPGKIEPGRIMQTQEIRLSYQVRSSNDSDQGYEMDYMRKYSA